ncbi:hypothetical protein [Nocardia cyriacigeorgica]|uniref:hypothetical protein n=1 Tax=Nocardia cyriacigeorgica TaxID=135487 RepID=UPI002490C76A|nr:hypothetical protein [Nocardia cyriacigeorgica]BDU07242.1 hypothetical protein FMUBM48_35050 [Nocardia cyriacigeorgica]
MPEEFPLDEDGRAVAVHRRVTVRTPGLAGRAIVHEAAGAGTRGAEQTTDALVTALALNEIEEDLTVEILDPRERTAAAGTRAAGGPDDIVMEVADPARGGGRWCCTRPRTAQSAGISRSPRPVR